MSSHFGWVARRRWANAITRFYYDDISLLNSICSRSILFRSRFNVQHRRFVETVRNECQIFISNLASEKKIHREQHESSLNSAKYENTLQSIEILSSKNLTKTRKSRDISLDIFRTKFFEVEIPSNCS